MIHTILTWMESHVWVCTFVTAGCAVFTFFCNFIFKKNKKKKNSVSMKIDNVRGGEINQANGNITNSKYAQ